MAQAGLFIMATICAASALVAPPPARAGTLTTLSSFSGSGDGASPAASLVKVNGALYGTTEFGGAYGYGAVVMLDPASKALSVVYSFKGGSDGSEPLAALSYAGGMLFGTTSSSYNYKTPPTNYGTTFKLDPSTKVETVLHNFTGGNDGYYPAAPLLDVNNILYGTTEFGGTGSSGTIFAINIATGAQAIAANMQDTEGVLLKAGLIDVGGKLYGTAEGGGDGAGTVFAFIPATGTIKNVYSFLNITDQYADGVFPEASLISAGGELYGTTTEGGNTGCGGLGCGTVFAVDPGTGKQKVLHAFTDSPDGSDPRAGLIDVHGALYGTTQTGGLYGFGTIFKVVPSTGAFAIGYNFTALDGGQPAANMINVGGVLYGTTIGIANAGTIFTFDPATAVEKVVHIFTGGGGLQPSGVQNSDGNLVAIAAESGQFGSGEVLKINLATNENQTLHQFSGKNTGIVPWAPLVKVNGSWFGTTYSGGSQGYGAVYKLNAATGKETVLLSFAGGADGAFPEAAMAAVDGILYGTTSQGGASGVGTVFSIDPATAAKKIIYSFKGGDDASGPESALIGVNGKLYGTAVAGGSDDDGVVYAIDLTSGAETIVHSFTGGKNGDSPRAALIDVDGSLYGGADEAVFKIDTTTNSFSVVYSFKGGSDGAALGGPLSYFDGTLYGTTLFGGGSGCITLGCGTVFKLDPATGKETNLYSFTGGSDGGYPESAIVKIGTALYGTTSIGGASEMGTIFKLVP